MPLMYGIFMTVAVCGSIAATFLPETFKQPFPENVDDIEKRKIHPYFSWRVW